MLHSSAYAAPITWTFDESDCGSFCGFGGSAGGALSGSFVFDADTGTYSSIDIVVTSVSDPAFPAETYTVPDYTDGVYCIATPYCQSLLFAVTSESSDLTGTPAIFFTFGSALGDSGGTSSIFGGIEGYCTDSNCSSFDGVVGDSGYGNFGDVTASAPPSTPEPATFGMIALGMAALAYRMKQRIAVRR
jgi:hypothetical protein